MPDLPAYPSREPTTVQFGGYVKDARINARDGEFILTVAVPADDKYHAMPATDHLGAMYDFTLEPRVYDPDEFEDVETNEMMGQNHHE